MISCAAWLVPDIVVKRLFEAIGEAYDPRALDFHENSRLARTASYAQVTEKLYSRSRFRYRNYLKHFDNVRLILGDRIERLGYSIDV